MNALRSAPAAPPAPVDVLAYKRRLVAELCRMLDPRPGKSRHASGPAGNGKGSGATGTSARPAGRGEPNGDARIHDAVAGLSPRMRQTLEYLLGGDSEKEIAARFGRSKHTVHVHVKKLYQRFGVNSRGELFSLFVAK